MQTRLANPLQGRSRAQAGLHSSSSALFLHVVVGPPVSVLLLIISCCILRQTFLCTLAVFLITKGISSYQFISITISTSDPIGTILGCLLLNLHCQVAFPPNKHWSWFHTKGQEKKPLPFILQKVSSAQILSLASLTSPPNFHRCHRDMCCA